MLILWKFGFSIRLNLTKFAYHCIKLIEVNTSVTRLTKVTYQIINECLKKMYLIH